MRWMLGHRLQLQLQMQMQVQVQERERERELKQALLRGSPAPTRRVREQLPLC